MNVHLTDEQLHTLIAADPTDAKLLDELRMRIRLRLLSNLPNPRGTCPHGKRVVIDQNGPYSTGYLDGCSRCGYAAAEGTVWDDQPEREWRLALADELRP
jgi:hypothetical protein